MTEQRTRAALSVLACTLAMVTSARAQSAIVTGQIVLRDDGQPLGYTTIALLSSGRQQLARENGTFSLTLPPGEVRLRFKRVGFVPRDTALMLAANDTARLRIEMTRLVIRLPDVVVSGACTDRTSAGEGSGILPELFDQVRQNAERMRLLAQERPFTMTAVHRQDHQHPMARDSAGEAGRAVKAVAMPLRPALVPPRPAPCDRDLSAG